MVLAKDLLDAWQEINQEMVKKKCFAQKSKDLESRSMYSFLAFFYFP